MSVTSKQVGHLSILFILSATTALFFQNCNNMTLTGAPAELANKSESHDQLTIIAKSSASANTDCSLANASFEYEIKNSPFNIRVCQEYTLTTPSRMGETYTCDSDDKFVSPPTPWLYDNVSQSWKYSVNLRNNAQYVPGSFKLLVKNTAGTIYGSPHIKIGRAGKENCNIVTNDVSTCSAFAAAKKKCDEVNAQTLSACRIYNTTNGAELYSLSGFGPANVINITCGADVKGPNGNATPTPTPTPGAGCVSGGNLKCYSTQIPVGTQSRLTIKPNATDIMAYKMVVPVGASIKNAYVTATVMTASFSAKLLVVSETAGSLTPMQSSCRSQGVEVSNIRFRTPDQLASSNEAKFYCVLTPGKTYFLNVASTEKTGTKLTCSTPSNCGFYLEGFGESETPTSTAGSPGKLNPSAGGGGSVTVCVPSATLKCVQTNVPTTWYASGPLRPKSTEVQAYAFRTPAVDTAVAGAATAVRRTGAIGKLVVISSQPGDVNTVGKSPGCFAFNPEVTQVSYVVNYAAVSDLRYCKLEPGKNYYANVAPAVDANGRPTV